MAAIYGDCNSCNPTISLKSFMAQIIDSYKNITINLKDIVIKYIKYELTGTGISEFIADMGVKYDLPMFVRARLAWKIAMPNEKFDKYNMTHVNLLKDIYLMNGEDWETDILFTNPNY